MSNATVKVVYEDTFFIVPRYIRKIPGMTLAFLDVYETIFQFWNKSLPCFLSNKAISERTGVELRQIQYALKFLEKVGVLIRSQKGLKRYFTQPQRSVESDWPDNAQACTPVHPPMHSSAPPPCTPVHPEYKEVEYKEINTTSSNSSTDFFAGYKEEEKEQLHKVNVEFTKQQLAEKFRRESLSDPDCENIFKERFHGLNVTLEKLYDECVDYWSQTDQQVYKARFLSHLKKTPIDKYKDFKDIKCKTSITPDDKQLIQTYCSLCKAHQKPTADMEHKIILLQQSLKLTDTAEAREALAAITKAEEIAQSSIFKSIVTEATQRKEISSVAKNSLSKLKDTLK